MKKILSVVLALTMVFALFAGTKMFISANEVGPDDTTVSVEESTTEITEEPSTEEPSTEDPSNEDPSNEDPTDEPSTEPVDPEASFFDKLASIVTQVLSVLATICEVLFSHFLW